MKRVRYDLWGHLGWQGLLLEVPSEWNPGRITGDHKTGSLRLDDAEVVRAEIEWREAQGDVLVSGVVDRFVEGLTREVQRKKGGLSIQRRVDLSESGKGRYGDDQEVISYESDCRVCALTRFFPATRRIVFIRVIGRLQEDISRVSGEVFQSLSDQPSSGHQVWSLYGLKCRIPPGFRLETCSLRSGHIRLRFALGRAILQLDRLSMAEMVLKGTTLEAWFEGFFRKDLRDLDRSSCGRSVQGHPGFATTGSPRSRWRTLLSPMPLLEVRKRVGVEALAWHCAESNRVYSVLHFHKEGEGQVAMEEVCRGVACHQAEPEDHPGGHADLPPRAQ